MTRNAARTLLLSGICAVVAGISVQSAAAVPPTIESFSVTGGVVIPTGALCSFAIVEQGAQEFTTKTFYNEDGTIAQRITSGTEQDTFSANGKTLLSDRYHFNFISQFENGVRVSFEGTGIAERVPLPDGGVFIVAGRVNALGLPIILSVDSGNSGNNLEAFCAALS